VRERERKREREVGMTNRKEKAVGIAIKYW
jgi:hypothetical protein